MRLTINAASPIKANYIEATSGGLTIRTDNALTHDRVI